MRQDKVENIERVLLELASEFKTHRKIEEHNISGLEISVKNLSSDIKGQREHFDMKISDCNDSITKMLKTEYATKAEIKSIKDETILEQTSIRNIAINEAKKEILARVRNYLGIVSSTVILLLALLGYILGLKP